MQALTPSQLVILDALWVNRVDLIWLFVDEETFIQMFNIPWHRLDAASCCMALAELIDAEYVEVKGDVRAGRHRVTAGLTELGGCTWESNFVDNLNLFLWDSTEETAEGGWRRTFTGASREHVQHFRNKVLNILPVGANVSDIVGVDDWEFSDWKTIPTAYSFSIISGECHNESVSALKMEMCKDWRKASLRLSPGA